MEPKEYEVEVVYRQRAVYHVPAADREAAERLAVELWQQGEPSQVPGYSWCELESVQASDAADQERLEEDAEVVLRFLHERERLILKLGGGTAAPTANDAISASQVASDLGWSRRSRSGTTGPDVLRATQALERLCASHRVVCFERPRVRSGERGDIRLYCTPEYLDRLTATMEGLERQVV